MKKVDFEALQKIGHQLLLAIGEDPREERIKGTPLRFAKWWREFIEYEPGNLGTTFTSTNTDEIVIVSGMRIWSLCEHHLLPFWAEVAIGYIPKKKILGLSKFARIAHKASHKLQIQERLVQDIADDIAQLSGSKDIAVLARGEHLCMATRGIRTQGLMTTSVMRGVFKQEQSARAEFLSLVK